MRLSTLLGITCVSTCIAFSQVAVAAEQRLGVQQNEIKDTHQVLTGADLVAEDYPGSWPLFGTDYRMKIGGYVRVDALEDLDGTGDKYQFLISEIAVDGSADAARGSYFNMFARETRFNFDIRKNTAGEPAQQVFLEMDFFDENSTSPRLRHAYFVYGHLVAGQTWSTLVELRSLADTLNFAYGNILYSGRPVQVRWQEPVKDHWSWAAAIEMPPSGGIDNPNSFGGRASPNAPALVARMTYEDASRVVMLGGAVGQLRWDGEGTGPNATAAQWALVVNGRQYIGINDYLTWNISYGDGTAENISALAGSNANATLTATGDLETSKAANIALGYAHKFTPQLTTNVALAWTEIEQSDLRAADSIRRGRVGHVNMIWSLSKALSTGVEYMWGHRENVDGAQGDAARLQAMVKYSF
ncbi:DcaP family trimeric outer membrane transporter [Kaarinaea lacus]